MQPEGEAPVPQAPTVPQASPNTAAHHERAGCKACGGSLEGERPYHRRYRVCKACSLLSEVVLNGETHRFCQQCGSFHPIQAFQADQRSCREQLALHAARRRRRRRERAGKRASSTSEGGDGSDGITSSGGGEGGSSHQGDGSSPGHRSDAKRIRSSKRQFHRRQQKQHRRQQDRFSVLAAGLGILPGPHSHLQAALHHLVPPHLQPAADSSGLDSLLHLALPGAQGGMQQQQVATAQLHRQDMQPLWLAVQQEGQPAASARQQLQLPLEAGGAPHQLGWAAAGGMAGAGHADDGPDAGQSAYNAAPAPGPAPLGGGSGDLRSLGLRMVQMGLGLMGPEAGPLSAALSAALGSTPDTGDGTLWQPPQQQQHFGHSYSYGQLAGQQQQQQQQQPPFGLSYEHLAGQHSSGGAAEPAEQPAAAAAAAIVAAVAAAISPQAAQQPPPSPPQQQQQQQQLAADSTSMLEMVQLVLSRVQQAGQEQPDPAPAQQPPPLLPATQGQPLQLPASPGAALGPAAAEQPQAQVAEPTQVLLSMLRELASGHPGQR